MTRRIREEADTFKSLTSRNTVRVDVELAPNGQPRLSKIAAFEVSDGRVDRDGAEQRVELGMKRVFADTVAIYGLPIMRIDELGGERFIDSEA